MAIYPNQKEVTMQKAFSDSNNYFSVVNIEAWRIASCLLSESAFKLWCYINKNQNGYTFGLSVADAMTWGISKRSYYNAVKELEKDGYLVLQEQNKYVFYELPQTPGIEITVSKAQGVQNLH